MPDTFVKIPEPGDETEVPWTTETKACIRKGNKSIFTLTALFLLQDGTAPHGEALPGLVVSLRVKGS